MSEKIDKQILTSEIVRVWEKSVETQIHFNDLIMRNRTMIISFVTAIFGAAAYSLKDSGLFINLLFGQYHMSVLIILFGMFFLFAYAYLDICYYLPLLVGSVKFTEHMDRLYNGLGLTSKISAEVKHERAREVLFKHYLLLLMGALIIFLVLLVSVKPSMYRVKVASMISANVKM